ncbi:MAG TPA: polyphosphate kinase 1 [Candidatus Pullichristensenella excrementigallinarum]|uniref:Polyphosphate kinase n=1 Tax=Candidatus Pullichristensenella excrementigallinarum TaxID=2840907 RepID=A0A9D1LAC3_9FIRM|nr:polyphosphate kinase 1 [Candidatus Pullichristensenella excrementigallinarum]
MQNRELSWLAFNDRVLSEATDETVPLLERLKFVSIFTSNLDEFFMIRVGSLFDLMNLKADSRDQCSNLTPKEQLDKIYQTVRPLYEKRETIYSSLEKQLRVHGICRLSYAELETVERKYCQQYFKSSIAPILSPQIVDAHHPFPHLQNKVLHIGAWVKDKSGEMFAMIPVPSVLPPVLFLPGGDLRYIPVEEILLNFVQEIFSNYTVKEKVVFCVTRNADINPDDEAFDLDTSDFRMKMKKALKKRMRLAPVRLELSRPIGTAFSNALKQRLPVTQQQIFITSAPLKMQYAFSLAGRLSEVKRRALSYPAFTPCIPNDLRPGESMISQIMRKDRLLSYPFESMTPFLNLVREAAEDPAVISIKITIYRLASKAKLVDYLCSAAERGKDVTVLIELRARFDEQNNIDWSERLEEAGCTVLYGFEEYKVHSKICLITRQEHGSVRYITQVGTGNYNERTAEQYTDVSLMTADPKIGQDAAEFFKNMSIANLEGDYKELLVAPCFLKSTLLEKMDEEIAKRDQGRIRIKINSITDVDLIEKLKQASCAGVKIEMIVRGICCILPGVPGKTENIRIVSIVGRFLEHSRIYCFGTGSQESMYISSADFMTRNTQRRVEVACPILDRSIREKLHHILDVCLNDNTKARVLQSDGSYSLCPPDGPPLDSQQALLEQALESSSLPPEPEPKKHAGLLQKLRKVLTRD